MKHMFPRQSETGGIVFRLIFLLSTAFMCFALYLVRHPVFRLTGEFLIVEDPLEKADALIVLSDDNFYADRATRAAELFREGKAPLVVASGRRLRPSAGIAELMEHDLVERGVPRDQILRFAQDADSTHEQAEALEKLARTRKWHKAIVVTSNYDTRRVRYIFRRTFPQDIETRVASARDADFDPSNWWEKRKSTRIFLREMAGLVTAVWEVPQGSAKQPQLKE